MVNILFYNFGAAFSSTFFFSFGATGEADLCICGFPPNFDTLFTGNGNARTRFHLERLHRNANTDLICSKHFFVVVVFHLPTEKEMNIPRKGRIHGTRPSQSNW